jgi:N6-L-threonylcarbamoyladenine synthase
MLILGIETSCDDTSVCLLNEKKEVLAEISFSQEVLLKKWGGIVPEIAARNHLAKLVPLLEEVFAKANLSPKDLDLIGVTTHPGLLGPLLTGLNAAKTLSLLYQIPIVPVNHIYAHLEAIHLVKEVKYPYLGLVVSGGHSLFFKVSSPVNFEILGGTKDDAAGEAFDKAAKILGLGYPGGKVIDDLAKKGNAHRFEFPIGLKNSGDCNLSFSGVKTSIRTFMAENPNLDPQDLPDVCASYQHAIVSALELKCSFANKENLPIVVGGGVACNSYLRERFLKKFSEVHFVPPKYCTDNGTMIANYALLAKEIAMPYPECLKVDSKSSMFAKGTRE